MTAKKYHLNPLTTPPTTYRVVAFDVEGAGDPDGFIMGVIYDWQGPTVYRDIASMRQALISNKYRGCRVFAHNLEYDWGILFQDATAGWSVIRLRSRLIKCTYKDKNKHIWRFWDTTNLCAFQSVAALGAILGMHKLDTPDWLKSDGTSSIDKGALTDTQLARLTMYCLRDTEIVYRYARHIQTVVNDLGGQLGTTLAGTAMDIFRRVYLKKAYKAPWPWQNEKARSAYYGGRTEVFKYGTGHELYQYDVHSMYPAVMRHVRLPDPSSMYHVGSTCKNRYIRAYEGITNCTIHAPTIHLPVLPVRVEGRLLFPVGRFTGSWCHNELRFAIARGYEVQEVHWQLIATKSCNPLREYVETLYPMKVEAEKAGDPAYFVYKILLNSLYGKFGQKTDGSLTRLQRVDQVKDFKQKVGIDVMEWQGHWYVDQAIAPGKQPDYVIVPWAAYITAEARLKEYELLKVYDREVVYCDTDCVIGPHELSESTELGGLGKELGPATFEIRAEKYYRWSIDGSDWNYKKAGIRKAFQEEFWKTGRTAYPRPTKIGESMVRDLRVSTWISQPKTDLPRHLKRCPTTDTWDVGTLIPTRPWTYAEAVKVYEEAPKLLPWRDGKLNSLLDLEILEDRFLQKWQIQTQIDVLREACTIPPSAILRLWDYNAKKPRRVRTRKGGLTTWDKAKVDEIATELGYLSGEDLLDAIERQAGMYEEIRRLKRAKGKLSEVS